MLVRERMTANPVIIHPDTTFEDALRLVREKKVRRLPVVDKQGRLVGIVAERDLLYASPSPATSLSVFEIHYLLSKLQVRDLMTKRVIAVGEDCPLEDAACIMVEHKIGSLPVLRGDQLVGIITETDIFRTMAQALGESVQCLRVMVRVPDAKGQLAKLASEVARLGGDIRSLVTMVGVESKQGEITMKVAGVQRDDLVSALEKAGVQIVDVREINAPCQPRLISSH